MQSTKDFPVYLITINNTQGTDDWSFYSGYHIVESFGDKQES